MFVQVVTRQNQFVLMIFIFFKDITMVAHQYHDSFSVFFCFIIEFNCNLFSMVNLF